VDIFAHTLWAAAAAKGANTNKKLVEKNKKPLSAVWAGFWGVAPDLFAFGFPFLAMGYLMLTGKASGVQWAGHHFGFPPSLAWIGDLPPKLYHISHSLVVFTAVFVIVWTIRRRLARKNPSRSGRPYYELFGWMLHILIDIPSHAASFYPTPFLWPVSSYKFLYGVSWANPTYMVINYSLLAIVWIWIIINAYRMKSKRTH